MQREPAAIAYQWLDQARADLDAGQRTVTIGIAYLACFLAQQSAEKALKALLFWTSGDRPRVHVIAALLRELPPEHAPPDDMVAEARTLDQYYTTTRYPDALGDALPAESFSAANAHAALAIATAVVTFVECHLPERPSDPW